MEASALFLLLLLPPADTAGEVAAGVQNSLRHELGEVSMVIAPETLVTPSMWQAENAPMRARFVIRLARKDGDHVTIELLAGGDSVAKAYRGARELTFAPEDSKSEQGRAIGLVIAELLRSSPTSAWAQGKGGPAGVVSPSRVELGAMFTAERPASGVSAYGPSLTYGFGLSEAFELRAAATALFGQSDQYRQMGAVAGANWNFLRLAEDRYAVGLGVCAGYAYESAALTFGSGDNAGSASPTQSSLVLGATLRGRVTLWRSLRLVAEGGLRLLSGKLEGPKSYIGDDDKRIPIAAPLVYSRWRPGFGLGLELAL
jgi:hypothetical protein